MELTYSQYGDYLLSLTSCWRTCGVSHRQVWPDAPRLSEKTPPGPLQPSVARRKAVGRVVLHAGGRGALQPSAAHGKAVPSSCGDGHHLPHAA